jgi:hypothetical protein
MCFSTLCGAASLNGHDRDAEVPTLRERLPEQALQRGIEQVAARETSLYGDLEDAAAPDPGQRVAPIELVYLW